MHYSKNETKKTYMVSKLPEESNLHRLIRSSFEDPNQYLHINPSMIIGRKIRGPRSDCDLQIVPHSIVGSVSQYEEAMSMKRNNSNKSLKYSAKLSMFTQTLRKEEKFRNPTIEQVDDNKLKAIFHDYTNLKYKNQTTKNDYLKKLPDDISSRLIFQEHKLDRYQNEEKRFDTLSKFLAKRAKKDQKDLLVNKTDSQRMKKEINELLDKEKPIDERYGFYNWSISLRRPKNFNGTRHSIINLGSPINPIWQTIKETIPQSVELVRTNNSSIIENSKFTSSEYLQNVTETSNINTTHLKELTSMEVDILLKF
jgi:hypothetical protein